MMRTWAEISLENLARNYLNIARSVGESVSVAGIVKANAYGHGAVPVSRALVASGALWLGVSNVAEGVELRQAGLNVRILVLGGILPFEREALLHHQLTPVIHSLMELREWDALNHSIPVHLKIDTGMARLGMRETPEAIKAGVADLKTVRLEGLMSHFATPDDAVQTDAQIGVFESVLRVVRPEVIHFASSFALAQRLSGSWLTLVRPGIALYGHAPVCDVRPVLGWKARVLSVKLLPKGSFVGYNARYQATRETRTAVIAAGYADGIPRALTNKGVVEINGTLAPIIGAVSMDLTTIDVTECGPVSVGDVAHLIGEKISADDMARAAGTISYEILTGIGNRVQRVYSKLL